MLPVRQVVHMIVLVIVYSASYAQGKVKDVCIIGAGASGMYAALKLTDKHYDVVVLEKSGRVGGHATTYRSEGYTGVSEMGVRIFPDSARIRKVFERFDQKLKAVDIRSLERIYANLETGEESTYQEPSWWSSANSLFYYRYYAGSSYSYLTKPGIQLPNPVPEDLLLNLGEFMEKYGLDLGFSPLIHYLQGYGDNDKNTMLYAFKNINYEVANAILWNSFLIAEDGVDTLYQAMAKQLGDKVIHRNTSITRVTRQKGEPVVVDVRQETQSRSFECERLIVSIPPLLSELEGFDLDEVERGLFGQFKARGYWSAIMKISGLPSGKGIFNVNTNNPVNAARLPAIYSILPTQVPEHFNVLFGANEVLPEDSVKQMMKEGVERLTNLSGTAVVAEEMVKFSNHSPFGLYVDVEAIRKGFYQSLIDLQGERSTYYIGATMDTHSTTDVWNHADDLIETHFPDTQNSNECGTLHNSECSSMPGG